jgi:hypothetical protein
MDAAPITPKRARGERKAGETPRPLREADYFLLVDAESRQGTFYWGFVVARAGVQPATFALGVRCSMHLSYRATW